MLILATLDIQKILHLLNAKLFGRRSPVKWGALRFWSQNEKLFSPKTLSAKFLRDADHLQTFAMLSTVGSPVFSAPTRPKHFSRSESRISVSDREHNAFFRLLSSDSKVPNVRVSDTLGMIHLHESHRINFLFMFSSEREREGVREFTSALNLRSFELWA